MPMRQPRVATPEFLDGGKTSCCQGRLAVGDCNGAKGPMDHVTRLGCGRWVVTLLILKLEV
jgi:hypothetical protein